MTNKDKIFPPAESAPDRCHSCVPSFSPANFSHGWELVQLPAPLVPTCFIPVLLVPALFFSLNRLFASSWGPEGRVLGALSAAVLRAWLSPAPCDGACSQELRVGPDAG